MNEACRAGDYASLTATNFYVGTDSTTCQFVTSGSNYVLDDVTLSFPGPTCGITSSNDGTYTTYTGTINYDSTGKDFTLTAGTFSCKVTDADNTAVATQITGWSFNFPDYQSTISEYDGTGMPTIVTMSGPGRVRQFFIDFSFSIEGEWSESFSIQFLDYFV